MSSPAPLTDKVFLVVGLVGGVEVVMVGMEELESERGLKVGESDRKKARDDNVTQSAKSGTRLHARLNPTRSNVVAPFARNASSHDTSSFLPYIDHNAQNKFLSSVRSSKPSLV
jgi:hypothetical protein